MRKIGVYGGTFNPIHNAHIHLAVRFADLVGMDRVLLIPTRIPPHKRAENLAPSRDRLAMCRLAAPDGRFEVSDMEIRRKGPSYTADTLAQLRRENPGDMLYLICGEDMFLTIREWYHVAVIFSLATICAAPRSTAGMDSLLEFSRELARDGAKTVIRDIAYLPVSSTLVRSTAKRGGNLEALVPPAVARYIREHHLYLE